MVDKTALAVHWAHRIAARFPDGQLYVNLRGFDPGATVLEPADALRGFLDAFRVPPQRIPAATDAQAALYRSLVAGRRVLIVLDNARDSGQVRPLLPGTPGCLVVITSRNRLTGLVASGAHPLTLELLSTEEAREFLARRLGAGRTAADPHSVEEIIGRCARLPLALAVVAAHATTRPFATLGDIAAQLRDSRDRLDVLTGDDPTTDVRAVFSWSYNTLTAEAAALFRLLGLHPGPVISAGAAASLAGLPPARVHPLLAELTRAHLLVEHTPGRYALHDLLRAYAAEQALACDTEDQRRAATRRMLDHYLHTAYPAARLLSPAREPINPTPPAPATTPERLENYAQAMAWFATEHQVLLAAASHSTVSGFDSHTWQLAWTLTTFLYRRGHWRDLIAVHQVAVAAAGRLTDPGTQARAHSFLAHTHTMLGSYDDAHTHLRRALELATRAGDHALQAHIHHCLGHLWERRGNYAEALGHSQRALTLCQAAGDKVGQAIALNAVGWYHALLGDHRQAITQCRQALTLFQGLDDRSGQAATWDSLGFAHHHLGHHTDAVACFERAIDLYRDLGDRYNEADTLVHLGGTHRAAGHHDAARAAWHRALAILTDLDHPDADEVRAQLDELATP